MKKIIACFLMLTLWSVSSQAENLSWDQCVQRALSHNPALQAAKYAVESQNALYKESWGRLMPDLTLSSGYHDSHGHPNSSRWRSNASVGMDLFNLSNNAEIRSARAGLRQQQADWFSESANVLLSLKTAFTGLRYAQEKMEVAKKINEIRRRNADMVMLRYSSGRESKGNMLRSKAELLQSKADLSQSNRDLKVAQAELLRQLGEREWRDVLAVGDMGPSEKPQGEADILTYVQGHPTLQAQKALVMDRKAGLLQERASLWPKLSLQYDRSFADKSYFPGNPDWTASGVLSLPWFSNGPTSTYHSIVSARKKLEQAEAEFLQAEFDVRTNLEKKWADLMAALEQIEVQEAFLEAARQRNGEADVRYGNGLMSYENWERIVSERVNFESSMVNARKTAILAQANWDHATGQGLGK